MSVDALLPSTNEGKTLVPLENHLTLAADLESGKCVGHVTIVNKGELVEAMTSVKEKSEEPQPVGKINQVTSSDRAEQVLELLALQQGALTSEQRQQLKQLIRQDADDFALNESELGYTTIVEHHVDTGEYTPIKQPFHKVFDRLSRAGLWLKTKKCRFLKPTVSYLRRLVTSEGIQPDHEKTS